MRRIFCFWGLLLSLAGNVSALTIELDYSYANGYFDVNAQAKAALEQAAADLGTALNQSLSAATDTYVGTKGPDTVTIDWDLQTKNPSDLSKQEVIPTFAIAEGKFRIYVGATTNLPGSGQTLGLGSPISKQYSVGATADANSEVQFAQALQNAVSFSNAAMSRGSGPRESLNDTFPFGSFPGNFTLFFGPVAGTLTFDTAETWHFDHTTLPGMAEYDFYTVMLHEMMHCLGLGNSTTWDGLISNGTDWTGSHVIALKGSGAGLIDQFYNSDPSKPDGAHIASGAVSSSTTVGSGVVQDAVMTPSLGKGERRKLTVLDLAFLQDLGYDNFAPLPTPTPEPSPNPTATPEPEAPDSPVISGPKKITTTKSKVKLGGFVTTPGAYVEFAVGKNGTFKKAKGSGKWSLTAKLLPGKNVISVVTVDPVTGQKSAVKRITVIRK